MSRLWVHAMGLRLALIAALALLLWSPILWAETPAAPCLRDTPPPGWIGPLPDATLWWFYVLLPGEPKALSTIKLHFASAATCQEANRAVRYVLESLHAPELRVTECR